MMSKKPRKELLEQIRAWGDKKKNQCIVFFLGTALTLVFSLLLFNYTVSTGGDDSGYVIGAKYFAEGIRFPTWHGAFYPIFLSWFISVFGGINVVAFKCFSLIFMTLHFILLFKTFKNRIPFAALLWTTLTVATSGYLLYYASQTYSEALFMLLQAAIFYYFYRYEKEITDRPFEKQSLIHWAVITLLMFALAITRNIGLGIVIVVASYLVIGKKYKALIPSVGFFAGFYLLFSLYKKVIWKVKGAGFMAQLENMAWKDFYKHDLGKEDFVGFLVRIWDNANLYLSKHFAMMIGLRPAGSSTILVGLTAVILCAFVVATLLIWKKNKPLLLIGIYLVVFIGGTFVTQQKHWDQERLILVYVPLMLIYLGTALFQHLDKLNFKGLNKFVCLGIIALLISNVYQTTKRIDKKQIAQTLQGDKYGGFSNDWQNYLKMCEWAGDNLPSDANVLCRKPNMAAIYGQSDFQFKGLYRVPYFVADSIRNKIKRQNITHVIMANLRRNPKVANGRTINTIQRALAFYTSKYPSEFKLVKQIGKSEPAFLFKIEWDKPIDLKSVKENIDAPIIFNPANFKLTRIKGQMLMEKNNFVPAIAYFDATIKRAKPAVAGDYYNRGYCHLNLGSYKEAIADFKKALEKDPEKGAIYFNLGVCYYQLKDWDNARAAIANAQRLGINEISREMLEKLRLN